MSIFWRNKEKACLREPGSEQNKPGGALAQSHTIQILHRTEVQQGQKRLVMPLRPHGHTQQRGTYNEVTTTMSQELGFYIKTEIEINTIEVLRISIFRYLQ